MTAILIVEDDTLVLETTRELLEIMGYKVFCAVNGSQAVSILKNHNDPPIALLLLDLSLPDINGVELLPQLLEIQPKIKTIICSGSISDEEMEAHLDMEGVSGFLQKPFNLQTLRDTIESVLL